MNIVSKYCLLLSVLLLSWQVSAQDADSLGAGNQPNKGFSVDYADDDERSLGEVEAVSIAKQPTDDRFIICVVREGQTIYDIAKKYSVDVRDLKASNDSLTNELQTGQMIIIYSKYRTKSSFISHYVEYDIKVSDLIALWDISSEDFKTMNPAVGKKVKEGQYVYIPISNDETEEEIDDENVRTVDFKIECSCEKEFRSEQYRVALLIPLYLDQLDSTFIDLAPDKNMLRTRQFQFMHFYEGFMLAIDSLVSTYGLNVVVDVYDVGQSVDKTRLFLADSLLDDADLIVGPFYSKSFSLVSDYAKKHNKLIVNPLSTRDNVIFDNPNVVKVKPSREAQYAKLVEFIKEEYPDYKISIYQMNADQGAVEADTLAKLLKAIAPEQVSFTKKDFRSLYEARKKAHTKTPLNSLIVEGQTFVIDSVLHGPDTIFMENRISKFNYVVDSIREFKSSGASVFRNNLVIACGDDVVFATEMLNKLNIVADTFNITLVGLPEWGNFNQLFIENLLRINTVCFDNKYIDYNDYAIKMFIQSFRNKYHFEPEDIAFDGFDIAWYFMKAFMRYGHSLNKCLSEYRIPLLGSQYNFDRFDVNDGQSNGYWHIYQYSDYDKVLRR